MNDVNLEIRTEAVISAVTLYAVLNVLWILYHDFVWNIESNKQFFTVVPIVNITTSHLLAWSR